MQAADPAASLAGRWAAKEAVIKAISNAALGARPLWKSEDTPLCDIEIARSTSGAPEVHLGGHARRVADALGVTAVKVSISHTGEMAVAQAVAQ